MPTWNEILHALEELRTLIEEIQSDLADPATEEESREWFTATFDCMLCYMG